MVADDVVTVPTVIGAGVVEPIVARFDAVDGSPLVGATEGLKLSGAGGVLGFSVHQAPIRVCG